MDAGAQGRQALRPRRRRRRLRDLRLARRARWRCRSRASPHARCVVLIEACEESGSYDLPAYVDHLADRIGKPSLVVCLDSGCGNYDQLWLHHLAARPGRRQPHGRGADEGVHSGDACGIVPSSFRILRQLLSRLEDEATGRILPDGLHVEIPPSASRRRGRPREVLGDEVYDKFPFLPGMTPMADDLAELVLNRTWRPPLAVTGVDGIPPLATAGNVLRPYTSVKLSLRLPPTLDGKRAGELLQEALLEAIRPTARKVTFDAGKGRDRLERAGARAVAGAARRRGASEAFFGKPADVHGRRRHDPVHGHARREVPRRAVPDHRRARPAFQRARPERVPAHPDGQASDRLRRPGGRRPPCRQRRGETTGVAAVAGRRPPRRPRLLLSARRWPRLL